MPNQAAPYLAAPGEEEVVRVVCTSISTGAGSPFALMESIRAPSMPRNKAQGIHAMLHLQDGWFVHWSEGPLPAMAQLHERLQRDPRHHALQVVHRSRGKRLLPEPWSMMIAQPSQDAQQIGHRVANLVEQMAGGKQRSPQSVVRRLASPLRLEAAADMADPEAFHRIGVSAAGGNDAFDMVTWLAGQHRESVTLRRVSGTGGLDSGSSYVEFMEHGHPCRLIAVARNSLTLGLLRAFLPDFGTFILLFSGRQSADQDLMRRMLAACSGLVATPVVIGVAPSASTHLEMLEVAQSSGVEYVAAASSHPQDFATIWRAACEQLQQAGEPASSMWDLPDLPFGA